MLISFPPALSPVEAGWIYAVPVAYWITLPRELDSPDLHGAIVSSVPLSLALIYLSLLLCQSWCELCRLRGWPMFLLPLANCWQLTSWGMASLMLHTVSKIQQSITYTLMWYESVVYYFWIIIYTKLLLFSETRLQTATSFSVKPLDKHSPFAMAYFSSF